MAIPDRGSVEYPEFFATERTALLTLLGGLESADWQRDTPCPGWSVLGLACHLIGDDMGILARSRDGYFGTAPPPGLVGDGFARWLDDLQAQWVQATRRISPRLVVDLLGWTGPQVVAHYQAQDPTARTAAVSWAGEGVVPVWLDQARELTEFWIHRQQLVEAVGADPALDPETTGAVLDALRWAYPYRLGAVGAPGDTVAIEVRGPVQRTWTLRRGQTEWEFGAAGERETGRLVLETDKAWRLLTNNLDPAAQRGLSCTGDAEVVRILRSTRAIIGVPNSE